MSDLINPSAYGVLPTGFTRMRLPEIRQAIIDTLQTTTGIIFETRTDSITGQFIDVFAEREATLWELAEAVYHAMCPISATGVNLDHAVSFSGVARLFAKAATVWCQCYGTEGIIIPAGSLVSNALTQDRFTLNEDVTISHSAASDATFAIMTAVADQEYWIRINDLIASAICVDGETSIDVANNIATSMLALGVMFIVVVDANQIRVSGLDSSPFSSSVSADIDILNVASVGHFTAEVLGPVDVSVDSINQIISAFTGWDSVNNLVEGQAGHDTETDDELRLRYNTGVFLLGAGTLESIKAALLQNVPGITDLVIYENELDAVDAGGRPPHSIQVIASGGDSEAIAEQIFLTKASGIDTYGESDAIVIDSFGQPHEISFSRPTLVYIWLNISIQTYSEEPLPDNVLDLIKAIIVSTGNSFGIGKDVIYQRFLGPIYAGVTGIGFIEISLVSKYNPTVVPDLDEYSNSNISIADAELSRFDIKRITTNFIG